MAMENTDKYSVVVVILFDSFSLLSMCIPAYTFIIQPMCFKRGYSDIFITSVNHIRWLLGTRSISVVLYENVHMYNVYDHTNQCFH